MPKAGEEDILILESFIFFHAKMMSHKNVGPVFPEDKDYIFEMHINAKSSCCQLRKTFRITPA